MLIYLMVHFRRVKNDRDFKKTGEYSNKVHLYMILSSKQHVCRIWDIRWKLKVICSAV